ncbi:MAG: hypothetical protein BZ137_05090 [Methanosphaera sp. rholeuAM130]|nr:MAG: hypothetical protein BZ137_05090 [Methanosphaera sp. rholeuAM130]
MCYFNTINYLTNINLDEVNTKINQLTTIKATVTTNDGLLVNEGTVTFTTTGYTETVNVEKGIATATHTFTDTLTDTLYAEYTPNDNTWYCPSANTTTITVTKDPANTIINIQPVEANVDEQTTITATVTTENETPVNDGTVTFTTTGYTETVNISNGVASTKHTFHEALNDTLTATFNPTNPEDYNPSTNTTTVNIKIAQSEYTLKIDTTTFTVNEQCTIKATIYADNTIASNITKGKITFKINGRTLKDLNGRVIYAKVINGTATIENYIIHDAWNTQAVIQAVYSGSSDCSKLTSEKTDIEIIQKELTLTINDVTAKSGSTVTLTATLSDTNINTGKIIFKINGKTVKDANGKVIFVKVTDGLVTLDYYVPESMKPKDYSLTAIYTSIYGEKIETTAMLTVND